MAMRRRKKTRVGRVSVTQWATTAAITNPIECLEERSLLSTAAPWPNPNHMTVSFAPDGTRVAGKSSVLFDSLGTHRLEAQWRGEILRAFQAWAQVANINFSVVGDDGSAFGAAGSMQADPRFGDIRIAALALPREVVSLSVRPDAPGTWSGDILINSSYNFDGSDADLYTIMLHEVGHALGLDHTTSPDSVMFSHANQSTALSASDIDSVQSIYGRRSRDRFDFATGNGSSATANKLEFRERGSTPLVFFGDITTAQDIDSYSLRMPEAYRGPATVRLRTEGISLLASRLTVSDSTGRVIGQAVSLTNSSSVLTVTIPQVAPKGQYYVQVDAAAGTQFAVGSYGVAITLDNNTTPALELIDAVLQGPYQQLDSEAISGLLRDPSRLLRGTSEADAQADSDHDRANDAEPDLARSDDHNDEPHDEHHDEPLDNDEPAATVANSVLAIGIVEQPVIHDLFVGQTQLFHLGLSAGSIEGPRPASVQATVIDEQGDVVASLAVEPDGTRFDTSFLLTPGSYSVVLVSVPNSAGLPGNASYTLNGGSITDPIGPRPSDPTVRPIHACANDSGTFCYPGGTTSPKPFLLGTPRRRTI